MATPHTDGQVLAHIESLVDEEHRLWAKPQITEAERSRLEAVKVELDRYWDLLRQRRARREFGDDPDHAHLRPASVVEKYEQ